MDAPDMIIKLCCYVTRGLSGGRWLHPGCLASRNYIVLFSSCDVKN